MKPLIPARRIHEYLGHTLFVSVNAFNKASLGVLPVHVWGIGSASISEPEGPKMQ